MNNFACERCDALFPRSNALVRHKRESCPWRFAAGGGGGDAKRRRMDDTPSTSATFSCQVCNITMPVNMRLAHQRTLQHRNNSCLPVSDGIQLVESAFKSRIATYRITCDKDCVDYSVFFAEIKPKVLHVILELLGRHNALKINMIAVARYFLPAQDVTDNKSFNTTNQVITIGSDMDAAYGRFVEMIKVQSTEFQEKDSGALDATVYTAGPRGFRPRGKNIYRKYDLNQNGPRPVGSPDDPYYDPYEDPSYNFAFKTRTYSRQENANRLGDVAGKFTYLDDIGERHNVDYIAGKNTGFHVKTPFPDSNPRAYGPLYFRGRGRPLPRGRTSIQRGLDGSYKFVSAGPDQRRTEVSDSTGHVRGSYTYLDDKGVQHSVHYIAGPETGYRVLKTVKGAHLPTVFPFERPEIIPADFYGYGTEGDVFDTAASGRPFKPGGKPSRPNSDDDNGAGADKGDDELDDDDNISDGFGSKTSSSSPTRRPGSSSAGRPGSRPSAGVGGGYDDDGADEPLGFGDLFGGGGGGSNSKKVGSIGTTRRPSTTTFKPSIKSKIPLGDQDDGSYKPDEEDGSYKPDAEGSIGSGRSSTTSTPSSSKPFAGYPSTRPSHGTGSLGFDQEYDFNEVPNKGPFGNQGGRPFGSGNKGTVSYDGETETGSGILQISGGKRPCPKCTGTIVTNIGYKPFNVPPGVSVRAHVQSIDLYPYDSPTPSEAFKTDTALKREQLNEASSENPTSTQAVETSTTDVPKDSTLPVHATTSKSD